MHIQSGKISTTMSAGGDSCSVTLEFEKPFNNDNVSVVVGLADTGPFSAEAYLSPMAWNVSAKGFVAMVKAMEKPFKDIEFTFYWIATDC